jgi:hypothetical protein
MDYQSRPASRISGDLRLQSALLALLLAGVASLVPGALMAKGPSVAPGTGGEPPGDAGVIVPMTPEQVASQAMKLDHLRAMEGSSSDPTADCPTEGPDITCPPPPAGSSYQLPTYARHQHRWFYCGPAVVQVVSNYTWGIRNSTVSGETTSNNHYKQSYISSHWTRTDTNGQTYLADEITGMNAASIRPTNWSYVQWHNPSFQDFHNAIIDDTWYWNMPLSAGVNPRDSVNGGFYLPNWASVPPSSTYGHYIAIRGYAGLYSDPSRYAYYNDSSGGVDEVTGQGIYGSTGSYNYGSYGVWETMLNNNQNLIW